MGLYIGDDMSQVRYETEYPHTEGNEVPYGTKSLSLCVRATKSHMESSTFYGRPPSPIWNGVLGSICDLAVPYRTLNWLAPYGCKSYMDPPVEGSQFPYETDSVSCVMC